MMKYKIGDRVVIKTWEELKKEFGVDLNESICGDISNNVFTYKLEEDLNKYSPDRVLTIRSIGEHYYYMKEVDWLWHDYMIKESEKCMMLEPVEKRFELMEL